MTPQLGKHFDVIRKQNLKQILKILRKVENATKAELAELSGLSFPTVGSLLAELIEMGDVESCEFATSTGGRRAERFKINPMNTLILTLFIEAGSIYARVYDIIGNQIQSYYVNSNHNDCLEDSLKLIDEVLLNYNNIRYISIGVPAAVNDGTIHNAPDYPCLNDKDLASLIQQHSGLPVSVENDVNSMVRGYGKNHFAGEHPDMVYIYNGEGGPGSGIMNGGLVAKGTSGFAGEIGFIPIHPGNNPTICNKMRNITRGELVEDFARIVAILACVVNPQYIILGGNSMDEDICKDIYNLCCTYIPKERVPECIFANDVVEDYYNGLLAIGMERYFDEYERLQ